MMCRSRRRRAVFASALAHASSSLPLATRSSPLSTPHVWDRPSLPLSALRQSNPALTLTTANQPCTIDDALHRVDARRAARNIPGSRGAAFSDLRSPSSGNGSRRDKDNFETTRECLQWHNQPILKLFTSNGKVFPSRVNPIGALQAKSQHRKTDNVQAASARQFQPPSTYNMHIDLRRHPAPNDANSRPPPTCPSPIKPSTNRRHGAVGLKIKIFVMKNSGTSRRTRVQTTSAHSDEPHRRACVEFANGLDIVALAFTALCGREWGAQDSVRPPPPPQQQPSPLRPPHPHMHLPHLPPHLPPQQLFQGGQMMVPPSAMSPRMPNYGPVPPYPFVPAGMARGFPPGPPFDPSTFNRGPPPHGVGLNVNNSPIGPPSKPKTPLAPTPSTSLPSPMLAPGAGRRGSVPLETTSNPGPITRPTPIARPTTTTTNGEAGGSGTGSPVRRSPSPKVLGSSALAADDDEVVSTPRGGRLRPLSLSERGRSG
ncbi:hypothetical protein DFP72DRAFT_1072459 [Ephemerocybe angulata]|uniref:Uncharacterized protein n=1 Tax=Ephemerocybe angulata TaxID=980116 RepID=A0A8H6HRG8_9AGAR|nr:hypothetical protein DFP72DRAFT_1072459 [Tulosesus angulatus]